jgi:hypothetical protein
MVSSGRPKRTRSLCLVRELKKRAEKGHMKIIIFKFKIPPCVGKGREGKVGITM